MPQTKNTIKELFALWKKKEGHGFFCEDGIIDDSVFINEKTKLLFIAKESNVPKDGENNCFWLKDVAFGNKDKKISSFRISLMANAYFDNDFETASTDHNVLKKIAYMNINKCGGTNKTDNSKLKDYAHTYKEFIAKEIELIDPGIIFCCSDVVYDIIKNIVKIKNKKLLKVYHISDFKISYQKVLECLKNELDK